MKRPNIAKVQRYEARGFIVTALVWRTPSGWHFDGPASLGPPEVRSNPRNVCWNGPITEAFAAKLLSALLAKGREVTITEKTE